MNGELARQEARFVWLRLKDVAAELRVPPEIVLAWIKAGDLKGLNVGTGRRPRYQFQREWVDAFLAKPRPLSGFVKSGDRSGVYIIAAVGAARYKIGFSEDVDSRLEELACAAAYPLELVAFIPGGTLAVERTLHRRFASSRVHREWFAESPELLAFIEERGK